MADSIELLKKRKNVSISLLDKNTITKTTIITPIDNKSKYQRIIELLGSIDIYEDKESLDCLPDYKFPEIRWDSNMKSDDLDLMTDEEIINKFQLLTKETKQQKREVCSHCYQTGKRGTAFDIPYFYKGNENWDSEIPVKGKDAERGCEGCAWYDFAEWRKHLLNVLEK